MAICIVQLGTARNPDEGLRIGTVRRPPRGVRKEDYSKLDYYDVGCGAGAQRQACFLGSFRAVHPEALVSIRAPLPARDAPAGPAPHYHIAGRTLITDEFLVRLLLSRRGALSSLRFTTAPS